jgi:hypothetical protein
MPTRPTFTRYPLFQKIRSLKAGFTRAFAIPETVPLSVEDVALLEQVADVVVARGMAMPTTLFLESVGPLNFIGSQALHFLTPILDVVFPRRDIERIALLLERRDTMSRLVTLIEHRNASRSTGRS